MPSLRDMILHYPLGVPDGLGGPGMDGSNTGDGGCLTDTMEDVDSCEGRWVRYRDKCGRCYVRIIDESEVNTEYFGDGLQLRSTPGTGRAMTYEVIYPDGSISTFGFDAPSGDNGWAVGPVGPGNVTNADGGQMVFDRDSDGALNYVDMPNGDRWTYTHDTGDTKIKSVTAPDGTYTEITYVTSGNAAGKLDLVTIYTDSSKTTTVSTMDYAYLTDGRLDTVTKNTRTQAKYEYDDNDKIIKVSMRSYSSPTTDYTRTWYHYYNSGQSGQGQPASNQTFVIRKHATDSNLDQTTVYTFYMDGTKKTYVQSVKDPTGKTTTYSVDTGNGRVDSVEDPTGLMTMYDYNSTTGAVEKITYTKSGETTYEEHYTYYNDASGNPTNWVKTHESIHAQIGATGDCTLYDRGDIPDPNYPDNRNNLWRLDEVKVDPVGGRVPTDQQWSAIDPIRQYEYYTSDGDHGRAGMLWKETVPDIDGTTDQVTEYKYGYGTSGEPYEWRNSPTSTIYQYWSGSAYVSKTSTAIYDDMGRMTSTTDANSRTIEYTYDGLGRQLKTIYGTGVETENSYSCCTLDWTDDEEDRRTNYEYDDANRVTKVWTGISGQSSTYPLVEYVYDSFGNKYQVKTSSASGTVRTTTYTYDMNNRVTKIVYPTDGGNRLIDDEYFQYDDVGNLVAKLVGVVDGSGNITSGSVTAYAYDYLHRLTQVKYNYSASTWPLGSISISSPDVEYSYYGGSRLREEMIDSSGTSNYEYDTQGRLVEYTPPTGLSSGYYVEYGYNNLGQKTYIKITNGTTTNYDVQYNYYANGWLKSVKSGALTIASYSYHENSQGYVGNRNRIDYGNTAYTTYQYDSDPRYRISTISHDNEYETHAWLIYYRDKVGNPLTQTDQGWIGTKTFTYDANNRLDSAAYPNPIPGQPAGGDYVYDWVGNRVRPPADPDPPSNTNKMVYNVVDQLRTWPGMRDYNQSDSYFGDGSLRKVRTPGGTVIGEYSYHYSGLMNQATYMTSSGSSRTATNTWDGDSNRVQLAINGSTYQYVYDIMAGIPAVIEEKIGGSPVYYYREPSGALIARYDSSNGWRYYHFDELGSTRLITDGDGEVTDKYAYDAWGNLLSWQRFTGSINQPYQYVGQLGYYTHYQDPEFNLLQLGVRFYDPEVGRFTQRDAVEDDETASYAYCMDRPLLMRDPSGKYVVIAPPPILIGIGVGLVIGCTHAGYKQSEKLRDRCNEEARRKGIKPIPRCDLLAHCFMGCHAAQCGGSCIGRLILWQMDRTNPTEKHPRYNHAGFKIGLKGGDCAQGCIDYWENDNWGND